MLGMKDADEQSHKSVAEQEVDDLDAASQSMPDYSQFTPQLRPKKKWPRVVGWTVLCLILLAGLGAGGWKLAQHKAPVKPNQTHQSATPKTVAVKAYTSDNFNLSFSYPGNWTVADTGNGKLTVTSPATQLIDASGQKQTGQIVMMMQTEASADFSAFKTGNAVAVLDSQKLDYAKPAGTQRADTYISFLQYNTTTVHGALDAVYITGDAGYQKYQTIPEADITKIDPVVAVTFLSCDAASCSGSKTPTSIASTMWADATFSAPIENMIKSIVFQESNM
jgi:hypothetical protein